MIKKRHGVWYIDFQAQRNRYRFKSPGVTRNDAQAFERRLRTELAQNGEIRSMKKETPGQMKEATPTLAEFAPRWIKGYVEINNRPKEKQQKMGVLKNHLLPLLGGMRLDQIASENIERFKGIKQQERLHPKTINNHLVVLHKLLVTAKEWRLIDAVPQMKQLKAPPPTFRHLSREEANKLIAFLTDEPWRSMVILALRTGLRYSELSALHWEDVNLEERTIKVRRSQVEGIMGSTKNNRIRVVPLAGDVFQVLKDAQQPSGLVFLLHGRIVLYKTARPKLHQACKRAGIPIVNWHDLRHTFASQLAATGVSIIVVKDLMGHADIKMTMRYSHLELNTLRNAVNLLVTSPQEKRSVS